MPSAKRSDPNANDSKDEEQEEEEEEEEDTPDALGPDGAQCPTLHF